MKPIWTTPKVTKYDDPEKDWFVWFRYNGRLKTYKKGINYIKDLKKREREANALRDILHKRLKEDWNPNGNGFELPDSSMTLIQATEYALVKKKETLAPRTYDSYSTGVKFFIEGIKALHLDYLLMSETKRTHIKHILAKTKELKNWSNKTYNKNLGYLKSVFGELIQWDIIEHSPVYKIKSLKVEETQANIPATDEQVEKIKKKLLEDFPSFYIYVISIFHTGIRPEELLNVQLGMVNIDRSEITLPPEITKTARYRIVPLNHHYKQNLIDMNFKDLPKDWYLFGSHRNGKNRGLKKETDFIPGPNKIENRGCASKLWHKLIKKDLGIDVNMYSMKHLGANKKILAGMDLDTLRELYGHTSKMMTMRYAKQVKEVYRKQIVDMSPDF